MSQAEKISCPAQVLKFKEQTPHGALDRFQVSCGPCPLANAQQAGSILISVPSGSPRSKAAEEFRRIGPFFCPEIVDYFEKEAEIPDQRIPERFRPLTDAPSRRFIRRERGLKRHC